MASYTNIGVAAATDIKGSVAATVTAVTVADSHFNFDGSTSDLDFGTMEAGIQNIFDGSDGQGTVEFWIRPESDGENNLGGVAGTINNGVTVGNWLVRVANESGVNVDLQFYANRDTTDGIWSYTIPLNEWTHAVIVYDDSSAANNPTFYINGSLVSSVTETQTPVGVRVTDTGSESLHVGAWGDGSNSFDGDIDRFAM